MADPVGYLDYLTNNGERYFPYTRVEGIINRDGNPFLDWMNRIDNHDHDDRYALLSHDHDSSYALISHNHDTVYSKLDHTHKYAGSSSAGGAANTALALDKAFTLTVKGSETGSVDIKGNEEVTLNLSVNHTHSDLLSKTENNTISASDGVNRPLTIVASGTGIARIDLYKSNSTDRSFIQFTDDGKLRLAYNNVPLDITATGIYYDSKQLATIDDIVSSGGSVDIDTLKGYFATADHQHTVDDITDLETLPNPYKAIFNVGGDIYEYDGSEEKIIPIDSTSLGCAPAVHDHDYSSVYSTIDHNHDGIYFRLDGVNSNITSYMINMKNLTAEEYSTDGTIPTSNIDCARGLAFNDDIGKSYIGATYRYNADDGSSKIYNLLLKLVGETSETKFIMNSTGLYYNDSMILNESMLGHGKGIDADKLDGYHADALPYVKGTEDVINLGNDDKSKVVINVSDTAKTVIDIRNTAGYIMSMSIAETSTDVILSITSSDTNMLTITKDKSTNQVRTDLYGDIYINGIKIEQTSTASTDEEVTG